jgi:hypothetical protein
MVFLLRCSAYVVLPLGLLLGLCAWQPAWLPSLGLDYLALPHYLEECRRASQQREQVDQRFRNATATFQATSDVIFHWLQGQLSLAEAVARLEAVRSRESLDKLLRTMDTPGSQRKTQLARLLLYWAEAELNANPELQDRARTPQQLRQELDLYLRAHELLPGPP